MNAGIVRCVNVLVKKEGCAKHPPSEDNTELNKLKDYFIVPSVKKR